MKVHIQNYQTIKDLELDINGFTVIIGKSNTGKTAILRAIEGAIFNDPVTGMIRTGEEDTFVTIDYNDIRWTWKKGSNFNDYIITTPKRTEHYSRVGTQAPNEIKEAGFQEWLIDQKKTRPQIASWYDPIFLLNKGGKTITELMTSVTRLDVVNQAIRNGSLELRKNKSTLKVREKDFQKSEQRICEFDCLDDIDKYSIDDLWSSISNNDKTLESLDLYLIKYSKYLDSISKLDLLQIDLPIKIDRDDIDAIVKLDSWTSRLEYIIKTLDNILYLDDVVIPVKMNIDNKIRKFDTWTKQYSELNLKIDKMSSEVIIPEKNIDISLEKIITLAKYEKKYHSNLNELASLESKITIEENTLKKDQDQIINLRGQINECPVCGRSDECSK